MPTNSGAVLWHVTMSLDGYITAPNDDLAWVFDHFDPGDPAAAAVMERTGAVVAGRRGFDVGQRDGRDVFDGAWDGPQYLLTNRTVTSEIPPSVQVRSGDITPVVTEAREAANGGDVLLIGANVARQGIGAGVVDELIVHVAPVLLGDGVRFRGPTGRRDLTHVATTQHGTMTTLHYRIDK